MAKRILLADDSITIQKVVELTFSDGDYEVTAVNNGTKAIQKLSEMRPDIILSDIIMPEKNGYEVCEFVKSHPEFRNIPVVLLTGTFEPFDPDRADKAGCDAVVTKPFESQSLIHKVEELIEHSKTQAPTAPGAPSPFAGESQAAAAPPDQFATGTFQSSGEIFSGTPASPPTSEMPFDQPPAAGGETRAFPRMSFEDMQKMAAESKPAPAPEPASPWDEQAPPPGGETRAIPRMSFEDMQKMAAESKPPATPEPASPWDEQAPAPAGETRAFPRMSFEDMRKMANEAAPPPSPEPIAPPPPPPPAPGPSLWDEQPGAGFGGETRALPKMSFDDLEKMASQAPSMPEQNETPSWSPPAAPAAEPVLEELPFTREPAPPAAEMKPAPETAAVPAGELTDDQIDRIARRVVQLMSEQVIRNIAWEVIPDLAETVVKERIRQLESE